MLSAHVGPEAIALRARTLIRLDEPTAALEALDEADVRELSHRVAAELLIVKILAAVTAGDAKVAEAAIVDARARSYGVGSADLDSELRFYVALLHWTQGRYADATAEANGLLEADSIIPAWLEEPSQSYPFTRAYWKARAYELLAMIAGARKDLEAQASLLLRAFSEFDRADCEDVRVEAGMLNNLAVLVRDLQVPDLAQFVRARATRVRWNDSLADLRFFVTESLGWCSALNGDHLGGLREFRVSAECAPTKPLKIVAILNRAFLAGELGENFFSTEELEYACQLASEVDWEVTAGAERGVLLELSRAIASRDIRQARRLLDRYTALKSPTSPLLVFTRDRRTRGYECMATAAVVRAEQQLDRATMLFKEAFEIWTEVGYQWRAATAALEIYTLTGDTTYLDVVAREAAARPQSWIARRYASVVLDDSEKYVRV